MQVLKDRSQKMDARCHAIVSKHAERENLIMRKQSQANNNINYAPLRLLDAGLGEHMGNTRRVYVLTTHAGNMCL